MLLVLERENSSAGHVALVAQWRQRHLGDSMATALAVHVHSPEARNAEVVQALVAAESRQIVFTLLTLLARLDDLCVRNGDDHGAVRSSVALAVQLLETFVAEILLAVPVVDLRLLDCARRAEGAACRLPCRMKAPRPLAIRVQVLEACIAEGHHALIAFQSGLHDAAVLARDLQIRELLVEELGG